MALTTHHLQGTCSNFSSLPSSWSRRGISVKQFSPTLLQLVRKDRLISLRCRPCSSVGDSLVLGPKSKSFKIPAFKGKRRLDDLGAEANGSKSLNNHVKVSNLQHESEESSVNAQNIVPSPYTIADDRNLFKKWSMSLLTSSQTHEVNGAVEEPSPVKSSEKRNTMQKQKRGGILKAVLCYFWGLDAAIKIPFLIFTPLYLAVNIIYGSQVSKELTPLWALGPLIMGLYVKMFGAICGLYIFTFKQTVKIMKNLPDYYFLVYDYLFRGKLKEAMRTYLYQPVSNLKNMDYNKLTRSFQGLLIEKYLDYIESIWPYYNRTIRFLKRANLI